MTKINDIMLARTGDKEAFSRSIYEIKDDAYKIAYCYLHNEHDALDAMQESIIRAYSSIKKLRESNYFKTWFIRIVINECKKILAYRNRFILKDRPVSEDVYYDKNDNDISGYLSDLDEKHRIIFYLKYYQGYTFDEISKILNVNTSTIKSRHYTALKILKTAYTEKEDVCYENS